MIRNKNYHPAPYKPEEQNKKKWHLKRFPENQPRQHRRCQIMMPVKPCHTSMQPTFQIMRMKNNHQIIKDQDEARGSWHSINKIIRAAFIALHAWQKNSAIPDLSIRSRIFTRGLGGANMNLQMSEWAYEDFLQDQSLMNIQENQWNTKT